MTIKRITISVPEQVAGRIKRAAGARPVSAWVTDLIAEHLDNADLERLWREFCADVAPRQPGAEVTSQRPAADTQTTVA